VHASAQRVKASRLPGRCRRNRGPFRPWLCRRLLALLVWTRGGEELGEEFCHALRRVVMHPVRGVGYALDSVEVGHIVVVGLCEFGAEVGVALPPDDECMGRRITNKQVSPAVIRRSGSRVFGQARSRLDMS
jgi:hypothetical protein